MKWWEKLIFFAVIVGLFLGLVFYIKNKQEEANKSILISNVDRLYFEEFDKENDFYRKYYLDKKKNIEEVVKIIEKAEPSELKSTSETPNEDFYINLGIGLGAGIDTIEMQSMRTIYYKGEKEYIELPFEIVYDLPKGSIKQLQAIYKIKGKIVKD